MEIFASIKAGFGQLFNDRMWLPKVFFGGLLLINPLLIVFGIMLLDGNPDPPWLLGALVLTVMINTFTFWLPLGFTYEVLRRAVTGSKPQLPDWSVRHWRRYVIEGTVKFILAIFTLIAPTAAWVGGVAWTIQYFRLPEFMIGMLAPFALFFTIPFCAVACCRWLEGASVFNCALNYPANLAIMARRWKDFLIASLIATGFNTVACSFVITIPFAAVFGLCLVDTWFGPIYVEATREERQRRRAAEAQSAHAATA